MGLRDFLHRLLAPAEKAVDKAEYGVVEAIERAEERVDEATGGRYYPAAERLDEESEDLLDRIGVNEPPHDGDADDRAGGPPAG